MQNDDVININDKDKEDLNKALIGIVSDCCYEKTPPYSVSELVDKFKEMQSYGADDINFNAGTSLYVAVHTLHHNVAEALLICGADPNIKGHTRNSFYINGTYHYFTPFEAVCLEFAGKYNDRYYGERTCFVDTEKGYGKMAILLAQYGADITGKDPKGKNYIDYIDDVTIRVKIKKAAQDFKNGKIGPNMEAFTINVDNPDVNDINVTVSTPIPSLKVPTRGMDGR